MTSRTAVLIAWTVSFIATLGSLFFSDVMKLPPCVLCWYQRILMYPLVFILATAWLLEDRRVLWYSLPLSLLGLIVAGYHNLLYYNVISQSITQCTQGVSCTSRQIEWFGFVTIPLLSFVSFLMINVLFTYILKNSRAGDTSLR